MQSRIITPAKRRRDTTVIAFHVPVEVAQRLCALAEQEETTVEALLAQAVSLLVGDAVCPDAYDA